MSRIATILTMLILAATIVTAQQADNWVWMNPKPQGNTIRALDFVDNNIGYAAGAYGTILKTVDKGVSWHKLNSGTTDQFLSLCFPDVNTGYVGGPNQLLKKTTNGGESWS
ncbi:MAG: YCF48-related protein, partial [bacterium]